MVQTLFLALQSLLATWADRKRDMRGKISSLDQRGRVAQWHEQGLQSVAIAILMLTLISQAV